MGLDISHGTWHGAYSAFHRWRCEIAKYAGLPPLNLMEGFYRKGDVLGDPVNGIVASASLAGMPWNKQEEFKERVQREFEGLPIKWSSLKPSVLHELLYHSDCEGYINWSRCKKIADALKKVMENIPEDLDGGGHIGNFREKTQQFIDGLMTAYEAKEKLIFA